jgi:hypothetical protein
MEHNDLVVRGQVQIEFHRRNAQIERDLETGQGVLRFEAARSAVALQFKEQRHGRLRAS